MNDIPWLGILVYVIGLGVVFLELFIPSAGVLGIVGALCTMYGIWEIIQSNVWVGVLVILGTMAYILFIVKFWASRVTMAATLEGADGASTEVATEELLGKEGETLTILRPSGFAMFGGRRLQVVNDGQYVGKGEKVRIVDVSGNRIVVTRVAPSDGARATE
ncbi:MAG TPA: NfeD family protein [Planctomycetota bacterium]|jgi:membrane-bound serine protease (ClpP class)|nr:hypothetical protein [Planctomycetota bacterium]OQC18875.1 MAG: hypothetical protein BWX69_03182 [Planctomycetes bacterium ADurb.Bin069]NMD35515.1 hypothetical protein [Planctomycetota bacterium]HNR98679.1 NfeD family protein [Planctomycetota bacterium]HNU25059.1 NfeD family protein [Planctomycetota bacterium]